MESPSRTEDHPRRIFAVSLCFAALMVLVAEVLLWAEASTLAAILALWTLPAAALTFFAFARLARPMWRSGPTELKDAMWLTGVHTPPAVDLGLIDTIGAGLNSRGAKLHIDLQTHEVAITKISGEDKTPLEAPPGAVLKLTRQRGRFGQPDKDSTKTWCALKLSPDPSAANLSVSQRFCVDVDAHHVLVWGLVQVARARGWHLWLPSCQLSPAQLTRSGTEHLDELIHWLDHDASDGPTEPHSNGESLGLELKGPPDNPTELRFTTPPGLSPSRTHRWLELVSHALSGGLTLPMLPGLFALMLASARPLGVRLGLSRGVLEVNGRPHPLDTLDLLTAVPVHKCPVVLLAGNTAASLEGLDSYEARVDFAHRFIPHAHRFTQSPPPALGATPSPPDKAPRLPIPGSLWYLLALTVALLAFTSAISLAVIPSVLHSAALLLDGEPTKAQVTSVKEIDSGWEASYTLTWEGELLSGEVNFGKLSSDKPPEVGDPLSVTALSWGDTGIHGQPSLLLIIILGFAVLLSGALAQVLPFNHAKDRLPDKSSLPNMKLMFISMWSGWLVAHVVVSWVFVRHFTAHAVALGLLPG